MSFPYLFNKQTNKTKQPTTTKQTNKQTKQTNKQTKQNKKLVKINIGFPRVLQTFFHSFSFKQFNFVAKSVLDQKSISISNLSQAI